MRFYITTCFVLFFLSSFAQFNIPEPVPQVSVYAITDTVYMDVNGNDSNSGNFNSPVKSFSVAIAKLPFGTAGINGGNAYGLILLKQGTYITGSGFRQYLSDWQNGNTFKNVSIEGIGDVTISGTVDSFSSNAILILLGSHIHVSNLKLRYSNNHGLLLSGGNTAGKRQTNILIDNVQVDSVKGFCMLLVNADTLLIQNSSGRYGGRPGSDTLTSPCQWPSGIKFLGCKYATIQHSEIAYTRGEGLNFQNSYYGLAHDNLLHDNGLNIYDDNSSNLIIRNNLVFNTPGINKRYWRNCPATIQPVWSGAGMMMANEGACIAGNGPSFSGCRLNCILPTESFNTVDSIYIFNNLFQNISSAFSFWEGNTNINGVNCIRNIFIFNNTVIGVLGDSTANTIGIVNLYFPSYNVLFNSYYSYLSNARVYNNIFSYDTSAYLHLIPVRKVVNTFHPGPIDITFSNNLWVQSHTYLGTGDVVRNSLPFSVPLLKDSTSTITPCETNQNFIYDVPAGVVGVSTDYNYSARRSPRSNVGAIEFDSSCLLHTGIYPILSAPLFVSYPNPFDQTITVAISAPYSEALFDNLNLEVQDAVGKILLKQKIISAQTTLNLANLSKGIYLLRFQQGQHSEWRKIIKQ